MKYLIVLISLFTFSAQAADFSFETTYWFNKIEAECSQGMCDVHIMVSIKILTSTRL